MKTEKSPVLFICGLLITFNFSGEFFADIFRHLDVQTAENLSGNLAFHSRDYLQSKIFIDGFKELGIVNKLHRVEIIAWLQVHEEMWSAELRNAHGHEEEEEKKATKKRRRLRKKTKVEQQQQPMRPLQK